jgi:hypothetical protein
MRISWKFFWHVLWVTVAFHAAAFSLLAISGWKAVWAPPSPGTELVDFLVTLVMVLVPYWPVFILAAISREGVPIHRWHVWGAWGGVTVPFGLFYLATMLWGHVTVPFVFVWLATKLGADHGAGFTFASLVTILTFGSLIAALIGALAGNLLLRLFRTPARKSARPNG